MVLSFSCALHMTGDINHHITKVLPSHALSTQKLHNPVFHWSNAFCGRLDFIQLTDGSNINLNHDDSAGFRLDTSATNKQYASPLVAGDSVELLQILTIQIPKHIADIILPFHSY